MGIFIGCKCASVFMIFVRKYGKKYFSLFHGPNGFQFAIDHITEYSDVKNIGTGMLCSDLRILG